MILNYQRILSTSRYKVSQKNRSEFNFTTSHKRLYTVYFLTNGGVFVNKSADKLSVYLGFNCTPLPPIADSKIGPTIMYIISKFLSEKPKSVLCYICSDTDKQDAARHVLFIRWYNASPLKKRFKLYTSKLGDTLAGMIYDRKHPQLALLEEEITYFTLESKPEASDLDQSDEDDGGELALAY